MTGNFLERWSRRKRENAADHPTPATGAPEPSTLTAEDIQELIKSLPDISTLSHESDFSVFMNGWVPEDLRREALRRLWTVDKSVLEHVPLADYALDYNTPGAAPGYGLMTASADMIADVARMMGKAAFPEPAPDSAQPDAWSADVMDSHGAEPVTPQDDGMTALAKNNTDDVSEADDKLPIGDHPHDRDVALREHVEEVQPFVPVRRRHGAAAPR